MSGPRPLAFALALFACAAHPTITATVAGGSIGFGACYIEVEKGGTCGVVGASTALFMGGLVALVMHFTDASAHAFPPDEELEDYVPPKKIIRATHESPGGSVDAGVMLDAGPDASPPIVNPDAALELTP
jgi:hypothetical protein